jgi:hypothetical protein
MALIFPNYAALLMIESMGALESNPVEGTLLAL